MKHSLRLHLENLSAEELNFITSILKKFTEDDPKVRRMIIRGEVSILARDGGHPMFIPTFIPKVQHHLPHHHD